MPRRDLRTQTKSVLLAPARFFNSSFAYTDRLAMNFARGALNAQLRRLHPAEPHTWEFSAFSQNGEDGVIDYLLSLIHRPNRCFIEVGASDGLENNSSLLAYGKKYDGVMVEADPFKCGNAERFLQPLNWSVTYLNLRASPETAADVLRASRCHDPDFFSLDIDGNDYFVLRALLEAGMRPKVICVEYNSAFGPDAALSVPYAPEAGSLPSDPLRLHYGVSVAGWRALLAGAHGYRFVTVETRGVNAFFVDPDDVDLPDGVKGAEFAENATQLMRHGAGWEAQFAQIAHLPLTEVA